MRTRDALRWNFAPADLLLITGVALGGLAVGLFDYALERAEWWLDDAVATLLEREDDR